MCWQWLLCSLTSLVGKFLRICLRSTGRWCRLIGSLLLRKKMTLFRILEGSSGLNKVSALWVGRMHERRRSSRWGFPACFGWCFHWWIACVFSEWWVKRYLKWKHVFEDVFFVLIDGIRVLNLRLENGFNRFDIGDVLEVKRMMFLMWLINFWVDNSDVGDVSSKDSSFRASDGVHCYDWGN